MLSGLARGEVRIGNGRWIKTVARVDAAEVNLLRRGCVGRIASLWGAHATTHSKLAATDAARGVTKIEISDTIVSGTRRGPGHVRRCSIFSGLESATSVFKRLGDAAVPLAGIGRKSRKVLFRKHRLLRGPF
jgi:hypothetical protein